MIKKAFKNLTEERRQEIIKGTMELYTENDFEDITMRMIQDKLQINSATFYRYFEEKDDLYLYVYCLIEEKSIKNEDAMLFSFQDYEGNIDELEEKFLVASNEIPERVMQKLVFNELKDSIFDMYKREIRKQRYEGKLRADVDEDLIAYMYTTLGYNLNMYFRDMNIKDQEVRIKMKEYLFYSFFQNGIFKEEEKED